MDDEGWLDSADRKWLGHATYGIKPDSLPMPRVSPRIHALGAVIVSEKIANYFEPNSVADLTYSGPPVVLRGGGGQPAHL